jgi:hypothetical protein
MKLLITIVSLIASISGLTASFFMILSDDSAMKSLGHWYLFLGVIMLVVASFSGIALGEEMAGRRRGNRSFRV